MEIVIKNLSKQFKEEEVLKNINLTLKSGNIYGIVGSNGSGKSVLLKIICSFYVPTKGEVTIDNVNYTATSKFPKDTRALIEKNAFIPDLSGYENLKMLAKIQNKIGPQEIEETLKKVNLYEEKDKKFSKYSMGMKQKLGIASVLMENPSILILDEPFNGIDDESKKLIINELLKIKKDKLIIITSHIKEEIEALCDKVILIENGKIINE